MRRTAILISMLALGPATTASAELAPAKSPASVTVASCHDSNGVAQRWATFTGQMQAVPGTARMAMRFTLLEKLGASPYEPVHVPELRAWRKSRPGARSFVYNQRVTQLHEGGAYRMRVQFRWYGPQDNLLKVSFHRSRECRQSAALPNLRIAELHSKPSASPGMRDYSLTLANNGNGEASDVDVALTVDGSAAGSSRVTLLPPDSSTVVQITAQSCLFGTRAVADPGNVIRETDESDNALAVPCP
jgi:CARDB